MIKLFFIFLMVILGCNLNIDSFAEGKNSDSEKEKINVSNNSVQIDIKDTYGIVEIENDFFDIEYEFRCYYLDSAAISYNKVIFKTNNTTAVYLGLDFGKNEFQYIVNKNGKIFYSSISFINLKSSVDLYDESYIKKLIEKSKISHTSNRETYLSLRESAYSCYACFKKEQQNNNSNAKTVDVDTMVGDGSYDVETLISKLALDFNALETAGVHYGVQIDEENDFYKVANIYALETYYDDLWDEYYSYMKIWEIHYSTSLLGNGVREIKVSIIDQNDIFISETGNGYKEAISAAPGYAFFQVEEISFALTTFGTSYISLYKTEYKNEDILEYTGVNIIEYCLGTFIPYYEVLSLGLEIIDNIYDHYNQLSFDEIKEGIVISSGEKNARKMGFSLNKDEVESGIFVESNLESFSFKSTYNISNIQNSNYDLNMLLKITPLSEGNETISYSWNYNNSGRVCSHQLYYEYDDSSAHIIGCNSCNYKFYQSHNISCENLGASGHSISCGLCSKTEAHSLFIGDNGNYCYYCDYFIATTVRYVSNRDGVSHTVRSGNLTKTEMCFGNGGSTSKCIKCNQTLSGMMVLSLEELSKTEEVLYLDNNRIMFPKKNNKYK